MKEITFYESIPYLAELCLIPDLGCWVPEEPKYNTVEWKGMERNGKE